MAAASLALAAPASAATVYEFKGGWTAGTPTEVSKGDVVTAEWRVGVNDDAAAPANEPVENVTFSVTIDHGLFEGIPDLCKTTGVDPVSALSDDRKTLTCNLGPIVQGTAVVVQSPIVADGVTGDILSGTGTIDGQTQELTPITIRNTFGMDMLWGTPTGTRIDRGDGAYDFDFEWTLFADEGSDQGPDTVSYNLTIATEDNKELFLGVQSNTAPFDQGCTYFSQGTTAEGHPYSHPNPAAYGEKQAPFVEQCSLVKTGRNTFTLTLTGIDYSQTMSPTQDSAGNPLPSDQVALASGSIWLQVRNLTEATGVSLQASAPTYRSVTGQTSVDVASNNRSSKVITLSGTWSHAWIRTNGGTTWDNTFKVAPGTRIITQTNEHIVSEPNVPATEQVGSCITLDAAYVDYEAIQLYRYVSGDPIGAPETELPAGRYQWYVGNDATVTPGSGSYNPDAFRGCATAAGWVDEEPEDKTTIKAVRWTGQTVGDLDNQWYQMRVLQTVQADAPIGQDVWTWGAYMRDNAWVYPARGAVPRPYVATPGERYNGTANGRDIVHVVFATPNVRKLADRSVVRPGEPATYTLRYSANGSGTIPATVDGYRIVDTLPRGMTYVPGSADPEPTITTDAQGRQVLTWVLNGVPTNVANDLTYQAVADDTVEPGQTLTNTVTTSLRGETSRPAVANVTTSSSGYTLLAKTTDQWFIGNPDGSGDGEGSWTVTLRSADPLPQDYTDTIDVLPYIGDGRGTSYTGTYDVTSIDVPAGATVYYSTADPATIKEDPADPTNGAAGNPAGNSVGWSTTAVPNPTAIRVIGGVLEAGDAFAFKVNIATDGAQPGDVWYNNAESRAEHTELMMRTSEPLIMGTYYSASLKKYVQDINGEWHDANDAADYPRFRIGDTIKYRIMVENTGQGTIRNLTVSDDKQPELGEFVVEELEPEGTETHEYEIVASDSLEQTSVNTACAAADQPEDSEEPVQVNCDPAGIEMVGDPTHEKSLISAEPIGDGQWEVVFGLDVTNEDPFATTYDLDDTLHFTEQATITSAIVSVAPEGVALAEPAWNGQDNVRIASDVPLLALDDALYAPHHYEVTVIADVPLQLEGAGSGEDDPTRCGEDGDTADRAFNNVSMLTDPTDTVEEDQACAEIPSISIEKTISAEPTQLGGDRWSVVYDIVATNDGGAAGEYAVYDKLLYGSGIEIESADVVTAPEGVTPEDAWTGLGDDATSAPNLVASGVTLESDAAHTYQVRVVVMAEAGQVTPSAATCPEPGSGDRGGLANSATIEHNGNTASDDVCPTVPGLSSALAVTGQNVDGAAFGLGAMLLLLGGILVYRRRKQAA